MPTSEVSVSFAEQLYALASASPTQTYSRVDILGRYAQERYKHLRLLDDIALLLVTDQSADVAAVALRRTPHEVIIYFSKNRPSTPSELTYIHSILRDAQHIHCRVGKLLDRVISMCRPKITSRIRKLQACLGRLTHLRPILSDNSSGDFERHFKSWLDSSFSTVTPEKFFDSSFAYVLQFDLAGSTADGLEALISIAYVIGLYSDIEHILPNEMLVRRLKKVGDYFGAVRRIARAAADLQARNRRTGRGVKVRIIEVPPPRPVQEVVSGDHLAIINRHAATYGLDSITAEELADAYPTPTPTRTTAPTSRLITFTVHPECTIATHMAKIVPFGGFFEIGVSKGTCWLCEKFIGYLQARDNSRYLLTKFHGKVKPGWTCPPRCKKGMQQQVKGDVADALKTVIERVHGDRGRYSFSRDWPEFEDDDAIGSSVGVIDLGFMSAFLEKR